jgi:hypothetical protein
MKFGAFIPQMFALSKTIDPNYLAQGDQLC